MGISTQDTKARAIRLMQAYKKIANEYDIPEAGPDGMPTDEMLDAAERAAGWARGLNLWTATRI